jgi:hypothetical protein
MRWTEFISRRRSRSAGVPPAVRSASRAPARPLSGLILFFISIYIFAVLLSGATPEKHLSVYSVAANYSLPLVQHEGRTYIGLLEVLEPLGKVAAKSEGARWIMRLINLFV